jgi:hypothetical protein
MAQNNQSKGPEGEKHKHFVFVVFIIISITALLVVFDIMNSLDSTIRHEFGYPEKPSSSQLAPWEKKDEPSPSAPQATACTEEARLCPNGTSVVRTGPDCEFAPCPPETATENGFGNEYVEESIVAYLLTQKDFSWKTVEDGKNFCTAGFLGSSEGGLFPLYVWTLCKEYTYRSGQLQERSGVSVPAQIDYPNEMSHYDVRWFIHAAAKDGSAYAASVKELFPPELQEKILRYDASALVRKLEAEALAYFQTEKPQNDAAWEAIRRAIGDCRVLSISQAHSLEVSAALKDSTELRAKEPKIDSIIELAQQAAGKCGAIPMATE